MSILLRAREDIVVMTMLGEVALVAISMFGPVFGLLCLADAKPVTGRGWDIKMLALGTAILAATIISVFVLPGGVEIM